LQRERRASTPRQANYKSNNDNETDNKADLDKLFKKAFPKSGQQLEIEYQDAKITA